jgi:PAS domain S-box-containing protein
LRKSEATFRGFSEAMPHHVWSADVDGKLDWLNPRLLDYLGVEVVDPESMRWDTAVHPDDFAIADPAWTHAISTGTPYHSEYRLRRFDNTYRWHLTRAVPIRDETGTITSWIGTNTDIDDSKAIAQKLADINHTLEQQVAIRTADRDRMWKNSLDILVITDGDGVYRAVSPAWTTILGHDPAEVIGRSYIHFVHPDHRPMVNAAQNAGALNQPFANFIVCHLHKNGDTRWIAWSSSNDAGLVYATGRDITHERAAQAELEEVQSRIRTIYETTFQFQAYMNPEGILLDVNPAGLATINAKREDVIGKLFWETPWFSHTPGLAEQTRMDIATVRSGQRVQREIVINLPPLGLRYCDISMRPVIDATGRVVGIIREAIDLTERRIAEHQLHQAQKMEAVGQMTGGLAHDFNNMLAVVISALKLLETRVGLQDEQARRYAEAAKDAAFRASTLTRRMLEFTRQQPLSPIMLNVNSIVTGMIELLRHSVGDRIELETHLADDLWPTSADANQLENIILNLVVNARDAMQGEGKLVISTGNIAIPEAAATSVSTGEATRILPGDYATISVTDTGCGMPPEIVARVFEPFFSTKEPGKGTGLGLSQVYSFVKRFGGDVDILSEVGKGTRITIYMRRFGPSDRAV